MNKQAIPGLSPREKLCLEHARWVNEKRCFPKPHCQEPPPDWLVDLEKRSAKLLEAIYSHCEHLSRKGKGQRAKRREAHYELFHAVSGHIKKVVDALTHNVLCQQQNIPEWMMCPTSSFKDDGLRLKWRIRVFVQGRAEYCKGRLRPRGATRNLLLDRCVPMIEELINLAKEKVLEPGGQLRNGDTL